MRYLMVLLLLILMSITNVYGRQITVNATLSTLQVEGWIFNIVQVIPATNTPGGWGENILLNPCRNKFNSDRTASLVCNVKDGIAPGTKIKIHIKMSFNGIQVFDETIDKVHGNPIYLDDQINITDVKPPANKSF